MLRNGAAKRASEYDSNGSVQVAISVAKDEGDTPEAAQQRAVSVKTFIKDTYGFEPLSESSAYITYLIARSDEERLPAMLKNLENNTSALEISDIQVCTSTPHHILFQSIQCGSEHVSFCHVTECWLVYL